jgi:hypothetical protein
MRAMLLLWILAATCWALPDKDQGTTVDLVPKEHAAKSPSGEYGFVASIETKRAFVAHSAAEFMRLYQRLSLPVKENGIWLSLNENNAYSPQEKLMIDQLKTLCRDDEFWLFIRTGQDKWKRISAHSPKAPRCRNRSGQELTGINYERLSPIEKQLIGTWESTLSGASMEVTFTTDHREFWCSDGEPTRVSARWRVERNVLVFTIEDPSSPGERRERIAKLTATEAVFTDGKEEGRFKRVR